MYSTCRRRHAAGGLDVVHRQLEALELRLAEQRLVAGERRQEADLDVSWALQDGGHAEGAGGDRGSGPGP